MTERILDHSRLVLSYMRQQLLFLVNLLIL